jgi:branched-chain amino acid transport system permease protein
MPLERRGYTAVALAFFLAVLAPLAIRQPFYLHVLIMTLVYACLGEAWNIVGGYGGQIALGNAVFFGMGAYGSALAVTRAGVSPWLGLLAGMLVSALAASVIGYASFKTSGIYFAIATLGFGELVRTVFLGWEFVYGAVGIELPIKHSSLADFQFHGSKVPYYYIILIGFVLFYLVTRRVEASRFGYYLRTMTASETAAAAVGIDVPRTKMLAFVFSAVMTAACGTFYAQYLLYIDPYAVMPFSISLLALLIPVLGGSGTAIGPLIGAAVLIPLRELTRASLGGTGKGVDLLLYAVLVITITILQPGGLIQLLRKLAHRPKWMGRSRPKSTGRVDGGGQVS